MGGGSGARSRSRSTQPSRTRAQVLDDDDDLPGADEDLAVMARMRAQALAASREASGIMEGEWGHRLPRMCVSAPRACLKSSPPGRDVERYPGFDGGSPCT